MRSDYIILFDGKCNFCITIVRFIIKRDPIKRFSFAPIQSEIARELLRERGIYFAKLNTLYLVDKEIVITHSTAVLKIMKQLSFPWNLVYVFRIIPRKLRDKVYNIISKNRNYWFGHQEKLIEPEEIIKDRFL